MLAILSPAKSLNSESTKNLPATSTPLFLDDANKLAKVMRKYSPPELASIMKLSDKLSTLNVARFEQWSANHEVTGLLPAILTFNGDVYEGFNAQSLSSAGLYKTNQMIRILSGLYGLLRPLDAMRPYRLEMGTKLEQPFRSLAQFWQTKITKALNNELNGEPLINLASNEYSAAVDFKSINGTVISPVFKDYKNGEYKIISFYAKKARGLMARYIVDNEPSSIEDLLKFDLGGYAYSEKLSSECSPCFIRDTAIQ